MASRFDKRIGEILKKSLLPLMRTRGFCKNGSTYIALRDEVTWLVDVQKSRWNDSHEAQFTINGGVYIPGVVSGYSGRPEPAKPKLVDCCLSVRIGMLDESRLDKWWKLNDADNEEEHDEQIAAELSARVGRQLLPFLGRFDSRKEVVAFLTTPPISAADKLVSPQDETRRHAYAAFIYAGQRNAAKAQEEIERAAQEAKGSPVENVMQKLRQRLAATLTCPWTAPDRA